MSTQKSTEREQAEHAAHLRNLAEPGSNYAFGYLNGLVGGFLAGEVSEEYLREKHAKLTADLKAAKQ